MLHIYKLKQKWTAQTFKWNLLKNKIPFQSIVFAYLSSQEECCEPQTVSLIEKRMVRLLAK